MSIELPTDLNFWVAAGTIALAIATFIVAIITAFSLRESKNMRIATQRPSFAVEPANYVLGGDFMSLNLVNHGQAASGIRVRCTWLQDANSSGSSLAFYILSLPKDGSAPLSNVPITEIINMGQILKIEIDCKDASGQDYKTSIINEFGKIKGTNTEIAYQSSFQQSLTNELDNINSTLNKIESKLDRLR